MTPEATVKLSHAKGALSLYFYSPFNERLFEITRIYAIHYAESGFCRMEYNGTPIGSFLADGQFWPASS